MVAGSVMCSTVDYSTSAPKFLSLEKEFEEEQFAWCGIKSGKKLWNSYLRLTSQIYPYSIPVNRFQPLYCTNTIAQEDSVE